MNNPSPRNSVLYAAICWCWATLAAGYGWTMPLLSPQPVSVPAGGQVWVAVVLTGQDASDPVCSARFSVAVQGGTLRAWEAGDAVRTAGKSAECRLQNGRQGICVVYGGPDGLPEGDVVRLLVRPEADTCQISISGLEGAGSDAAEKELEAGPAAMVGVGGSYTPHKADQNGDWKISLSELLRVIQFYNVGAYSCLSGTEDGYWPGAGDHACLPHDSDYQPQDWQISLGEVLRIVQFFNMNGYGRREGTEDGFMAGGFWF
ncbi:MAG TPA: hypothetical protein PLO53_12530 [Candidatus Hydrogenedentes bacterium]|nr:hypothetical protein [Candidatus Hydrogenedentota bacterium]